MKQNTTMVKKGPGRPKTRTHSPTKAAAKGTKAGEEKYIISPKNKAPF